MKASNIGEQSRENTGHQPVRNEALDGFRALAVLAVIAFHYLADLALRPGEGLRYYPFGAAYVHVPFLPHGNMGVQLFFMISGFVIALTLQTSTSARDFAIKRFARLFPAMFLCSLLTLAVLTLLPFKTWQVEPLDFVPSWTFISDRNWTYWLGHPVSLVDTVYWTLFVEVKFYLLAAFIHFAFRRVPLVAALGLLMFAEMAVGRIFFGTPEARELFKDWTLYDFLPLFVGGVAFRALSINRKDPVAIFFAVASFMVLLVRAKAQVEPSVLIILFYALFVGLVYAPRSVAIFTWKPLVAIGAWSYALYLLHNRIGVALTYNLGLIAPSWLQNSVLIPLAVASLLIFVSALVFRWWEAPARHWIRKATEPRIASKDFIRTSNEVNP
jgi:peptidoglycan/LPS O-acetylase OafA/YrhL